MKDSAIFSLRFSCCCVLLTCVKRLFDTEALRTQIANLKVDRDRIDQAIHALEAALRNIESIETYQGEFELDPLGPDVTVQEAVKQSCSTMIDGITRQRVLDDIERRYPLLKPNSSSVSAALINLAKGDNPMLRRATEGRGRSPSVYSADGEIVIQLNSEEISGLMEPINGVGGWQSLWSTFQEQFDKSKGEITLSPSLRAKLYYYFHSYGGGGYQGRVRRVFRRTLPHLFST
jgi:hypothetical protein